MARRIVRELERRVRDRPPVRVTVTNPERLTFPRDGIRKREVVGYYEAVAPAMLAALRDRPLQFSHWPKDIDHAPWFQQNIGDEAEGWMTLANVVTRSSKRVVRHLVADRPEALRWLAQHNALEIHCFSSRMESLDEPDWLVFDLDPAPGEGIQQAVPVAQLLRELFERLEIPVTPKTSGRRGLHLYVGLAPGHTHEQAIAFATHIGAAVTRLVPGTTMVRSPGKRAGKLYVDCFQNGRGKTLIAPYSLRAVDGAPVSTPLKWSEVTKKLDPLQLNLRTVPKRLDRFGDLFAPVLTHRVALPALH